MDFTNIEIGDSYRTETEKRRAIWVFRIVTKPFLVRIGKILLKIALFLRIPIKPFTNFMFKHFCGGENLHEVLSLSERLGKYNVKTIPDYSIEGAADEKSFKNLIREVKRVIDLAADNKNIPFAVFKPTGLISAEFLEQETPANHPSVDKYKKRLDEVFSYAKIKGVRVLVDAEDYKYQARIDEVLLDFMHKYNKEKSIVFTTLQMYRHDRLDYLRFLIDFAKREQIKIGVKFVRGAYMEKERERAKQGNYPDPIYPTKQDTDEAFDNAIALALENLEYLDVFNGTHNEESVRKMISLMKTRQLSNDDERLWFSQLYGMRDNITFKLASEQYNVAKYVPYGPIKEVMPYLVRRAEENSSMSSQVGEELTKMRSM